VHLLDATVPGRTPLRDYEAMNRELALYDPELAARPQIVVLNKIDIPDVKRRVASLSRSFARRGIKLAAISAATGEGTAELLESVWRALPSRSTST
jgi:GTP-binding protein